MYGVRFAPYAAPDIGVSSTTVSHRSDRQTAPSRDRYGAETLQQLPDHLQSPVQIFAVGRGSRVVDLDGQFVQFLFEQLNHQRPLGVGQ